MFEKAKTNMAAVASKLVAGVACCAVTVAHPLAAAPYGPVQTVTVDAPQDSAPTPSPAVVEIPDSPTDVILTEALAFAVATHPSVRAAAASARAAGADLRAARWGRFPSITVEGIYIQTPQRKFQPQVVVEQSLWAAGRVSETIKRADAVKQAALAAYDEAAQAIALNVVRTYYDLVRNRYRVDALQESLARHREMAASMERRVEQKVSPQSDLELARARVSQVEQQLAAAEGQARISLALLRDLVGRPDYSPDQLPFEPTRTWGPIDEPLLIEAAKQNDPTIRKLMAEIDIATASARILRSEMFPELAGQYSYSEIIGHRFGIVLRAQTGARGLSQSAAAAGARSREDAAREQLVAAQLAVASQVVTDIEDHEANKIRALSATGAETATERVTASYMRQFASGRRTWLDVMNAVRESTAARLDSIDARISTDAAIARLKIRTGSWAVAKNGSQE